jgi:segregation and condensation protein A
LITKVQGKEIVELPKDLYIPPDAMLVMLEIFEGPLDLLLYLIKKHNIDIIDIPVASITKQYIEYLNFTKYSNLELIADYLEMAAILIEIKSRMLLPILPSEQQTEEDPRAELVRRLKEYEQIRQAAFNLDLIPRQERDFFIINLSHSRETLINNKPEVKIKEVLVAYKEVMHRQELQVAHHIAAEKLSVKDKMLLILNTLKSLQEINPCSATDQSSSCLFSNFFNSHEGKLGIVVAFLAILELTKQNLLDLIQQDHFLPIYIKLT